jgi:hypothetical protein
MAIEESMLEHDDNWNIVNHVLKWLMDYAKDVNGEMNELDAVKARLAMLTKGRIAGMDIKGY